MRGIPALQATFQSIRGSLGLHLAKQHSLTHLGQFIPQLGRTTGEDLGRHPNGRVTLIAPLHHLFGRRIGDIEEVVGEGEESRQRVGIELGKLRRRQPLQESHCTLFILAGRVHPHTDIGVVGKETAITLFGHRRTHDAKIDLAGEGGNLPGARHVEGGLARSEQLVTGRIIAALATFTEVGTPAGQLVEHLHILRVVQPLLPADQCQTAVLSFPVVGANVLEPQFGGNPALGTTHGQRHITPVGLDLVQHGEELVAGLRQGEPQLTEDLLVIEEAMDHRGHRHTEGLGTGVRLPG